MAEEFHPAFIKNFGNIMTSLLVIIPDKLSAIIQKGEISERYYNPGNLFDDVHILMVNDDHPDPKALQPMVGEAKLHLHNLPIPPGRFFHRTLGWQPRLMRPWAKKAIHLARKINPSLIRCHGNNFNAYLAAEIKRKLHIPYVVSIHTHPDNNRKYWTEGFKPRILAHAFRAVERYGLQNADKVIAVYKSILSYTNALKISNVKTIYNVVNNSHPKEKSDYSLKTPPRILSVGRHIPGKCPDNMIRALAAIDAELHMVGDGALHEYLKTVAKEAGVSDRVQFTKAIPNDELCAAMPAYDLFAVHTDYDEIPKTILEALLAGLPVVVNRKPRAMVPEYIDADHLLLVDNTVDAYQKAFQQLLTNSSFREQLGKRGATVAKDSWNPEKMEAAYTDVYKELMISHNE